MNHCRSYRIRLLVEDFRGRDRKSTRLNSSHSQISYAVFCLKKNADEVDQPVALADVQPQVGIAGEEPQQPGQPQMPRQPALHVDPEKPPPLYTSARPLALLY